MFSYIFYLYPFLVLWHSLVSVAHSVSTGFVSLVNSGLVKDREWEAGSAIFSKRVHGKRSVVHWQWEQCRFRASSCLREGRVRSRTPWFWCSCVRCQKHFRINAKRFRCTEVPFQPNTNVLSGRHVVTVGAKCLRCLISARSASGASDSTTILSRATRSVTFFPQRGLDVVFFHESGACASWIVEVSERNQCSQKTGSTYYRNSSVSNGATFHFPALGAVLNIFCSRNRQMITLLSWTKGPSRVDTTVSEL